MLFRPDTTARQSLAYNTSNTNTVTITLNAVTGGQYVLDRIFWSLDKAPVANSSHITIEDNTAGANILKWDLTALGPNNWDLGGIVCNASAKIVVTLLADTPGTDAHLAVLYR